MAAGDNKLVYGTAFDLTITLASLAPSSTYLAGRESAEIDNGTNKYLDLLISGKIKTNATITAGGRIEVWAVPSWDDGTNWPDVFDGTDSDETISNVVNKYACMKPIQSMQVDTSDTYHFAGISIASLFGVVPRKMSVFVTHYTHATNALSSTAGDHKIRVLPVYSNVAAL